MKRPGGRSTWQRLAFFAWLGLLAANLVAFGAFTLPRTLRERRLAQGAARLRAEVEQARERNRLLRERDEVADQNERDVRRFYGGVLRGREDTLLPVLGEIEAVARDLRLDVGQQSYESKPVKNSNLVRFRISLPVNGGSYAQVVAFLDRLERSSQFITVDEIELRERPGGAGGAPGTDLALSVSTYFRVPAAPAAATPASPVRRATGGGRES